MFAGVVAAIAAALLYNLAVVQPIIAAGIVFVVGFSALLLGERPRPPRCALQPMRNLSQRRRGTFLGGGGTSCAPTLAQGCRRSGPEPCRWPCWPPGET